MFERSFNVIATPAAGAGTVVGDFDIGRSDADKELYVEASASVGAFVIFAGQLSTAECAAIINATGVNKNEVIAGVGGGGRTCVGIEEGVRHLTVFLASGPLTFTGICTVRVTDHKR